MRNFSLSDFDYALPPDRIAKEPARPRDASRMLVVDRSGGTWADSTFANLAAHLAPSDLLVLNNTRVLKARLFGNLERSGRSVEVLFVSAITERRWDAMLHPGRRVREGDRILLAGGISLRAGGRGAGGLREVEVENASGTIEELLDAVGHLPLPPYIDRADRPADETDYQTIYGREAGAIAAPTAGLHFSERIFESLAERGVETTEVTLHVGIGTFMPVRTDDPRAHHLKPERYTVSDAAAEALERARAERRRIVAVGTTTTRTLEYVLGRHARFVAGSGWTDLYILPGYRFAAVTGLLTNFHLPRTTLLMLVAAFASRELVLDAYKHAINRGYRFYSYGDCTLFL